MLVIRLARTGKKKQAYFRVVVQEKQKAVGAKFVEILGNYNPHEKKLEIDKGKLQEYMKNGAQPSNTLAKVLKTEKIEMPKWVEINEKNRPPKKKEEEKKKEAVEAPKEEVGPESDGEAPKEETKEEKTEEPKEEAREEKSAEDNPSTPEATKDDKEKSE